MFGLFKLKKLTNEECIAELPPSISRFVLAYYEQSTEVIYVTMRRDILSDDIPEILSKQLSTDRLLPLSKLALESKDITNSATEKDFISVLSSKDIVIYREINSGEMFVSLSDNPSELTHMYNPKTGKILTYEEWKIEFH